MGSICLFSYSSFKTNLQLAQHFLPMNMKHAQFFHGSSIIRKVTNAYITKREKQIILVDIE